MTWNTKKTPAFFPEYDKTFKTKSREINNSALFFIIWQSHYFFKRNNLIKQKSAIIRKNLIGTHNLRMEKINHDY
jgi:hypothetical protein